MLQLYLSLFPHFFFRLAMAVLWGLIIGGGDKLPSLPSWFRQRCNSSVSEELPWNIAELILMRTIETMVPVQKLSCQWSVSTFVIAHVTPNKRMTKIKLTNNLGVVLKWCPKEAFNNRNVTLGTMEAMAMLEFHESCTAFNSFPVWAKKMRNCTNCGNLGLFVCLIGHILIKMKFLIMILALF